MKGDMQNPRESKKSPEINSDLNGITMKFLRNNLN
jgi:hypothetical protein